MRPTTLLAALLVACNSENEVKDGADPPTDGVDPPATSPSTTPTPSTTTSTTTTTTTSTTTTTGSGPPAPTLPAECPYVADAAAVGACAAGGWAALVGGIGYPTVGQAIGAAGAYATVVVCPGTWPGPIAVNGPITLTAADPAPTATVIDGGGVVRGLDVTAPATIVGLTVWQGTDGYGAGGMSAVAGVTVECATFLENDAGYAGGAIEGSGPLTIRWSTFEANRAAYEGGAVAIVGDLVIEGSTFVGNYADYEGGALSTGAFSNDTITITDSTFAGNEAAYEGGAADVGSWGDDVITVAGCVFEDNLAPSGGGALAFGSWGSITGDVADSSFARNSGGTGGAVSFDGWLQNGSALTISASTFEDNVAGDGGFLGVTSVAGVVDVVGTDLVVLRNSGAAALVLTATATLDCTNCDLGAAGSADDNTPVDAVKDGLQTADLPLSFVL